MQLPDFTSFHPGYERTKEKEAERRKTLFRNLRAFARRAPCKARTPPGVPPRFLSKGLTHPKDSASDQAADRWRGYPAGAGPGYSDAPRVPVMVPAGMMSDAAREQR
jgi:hypothetical protein